MAQPTTSHSNPTQQAPTPGVGNTGSPSSMRMPGPGQQQGPEVESAAPVLFEDIDPVLLVRLYPEAINATDARSAAMAAGTATHDAGMHLVAAQQEPVIGQPDLGEPAHATPRQAPRHE